MSLLLLLRLSSSMLWSLIQEGWSRVWRKEVWRVEYSALRGLSVWNQVKEGPGPVVEWRRRRVWRREFVAAMNGTVTT